MNELVIKYAGGKMVLHLDKLFPRTKGWLTEFEKKVLRYCPDREEVVEQMLDYLTGVKIPRSARRSAEVGGRNRTGPCQHVSLSGAKCAARRG